MGNCYNRLHDATKGALTREGLPLKIAAASIAATIGSALANPADLVKGQYCHVCRALSADL